MLTWSHMHLLTYLHLTFNNKIMIKAPKIEGLMKVQKFTEKLTIIIIT